MPPATHAGLSSGNAHQNGVVQGFKRSLRGRGSFWGLRRTSLRVFLQGLPVVPYTSYSYA